MTWYLPRAAVISNNSSIFGVTHHTAPVRMALAARRDLATLVGSNTTATCKPPLFDAKRTNRSFQNYPPPPVF